MRRIFLYFLIFIIPRCENNNDVENRDGIDGLGGKVEGDQWPYTVWSQCAASMSAQGSVSLAKVTDHSH